MVTVEIRALIFDFDGLILDTEVPLYEAWQEDYREFGHDLPLEVYAGCVGSDFGGFDPKQHLEDLSGETIDWDRRDIERQERADSLIHAMTKAMDGVADRLTEARDRDLLCAVASSSTRSWVEPHLERLGLDHHFEFTRCRDDVSAPKPSPELFLAAADGLGCGAAEVLVFEDSLNGLNAAVAAGMRCVAVPNRITRHLDFSAAALILESLASCELEAIIRSATGRSEDSEPSAI